MTTPSTRWALLAFVIGAWLAPQAASADQPLQTGPGNDSRAPAVAYNSNADQYFVVFEAPFGRLEGQIRDADGTLITSIDKVLPFRVGTVIYREPRITYRPGDDQYVMTTILEIPPSGPLGIPDVRVTVTGLDEAGEVIWTDDVPGFVDLTAETPDIMADTFPNCCTLVTWKQSFGTVYAQRYDADGVPQGPRIEVYRDGGISSARAYNPRIAYQRLPRDDFAVVYQLARRGNPGLVRARTVEPLSGSLGAVQDLATMVADPWPGLELFNGGVDIAYDEVGDRYYVAWRDEDGVWMTRPDSALEGGGKFYVFQDNPQAGYWSQDGTPEVTVADGLGKVYVTNGVRLDGVFGSSSPAHWISGWWFTATGAFGSTPLSTWWYPEVADNVVGAYSPVTGKVFGVWERDEAGVVPPSNDLYFELGTPP